MKNLIVAVILATLGITTQAASLCGDVSVMDRKPWPWGSEVSLPWKNITGVWEVADGSCENLFVFKVKTVQSGQKIVEITQYDPTSCKVIAQGLGYEGDRYIYAQMAQHGRSYNLTIHAFNQSDVSSITKISKGSLRSSDPSGKVVLALTLSPVGQWDDRSAFQIVRVKSSAAMACDSQ